MCQTPGWEGSKDQTALPQFGRVYETKQLNSQPVIAGVRLQEGGNYNTGQMTAKPKSVTGPTGVTLNVITRLGFPLFLKYTQNSSFRRSTTDILRKLYGKHSKHDQTQAVTCGPDHHR